MKLKKENIYINLQGKSKEELTDLWEFLNSNGEINFSDLDTILEELEEFKYYEFYINDWVSSVNIKDKKEVTIQQLKEILQPMDLTLEQQLEKAEAEVKRLKEAIEDSKIKVGDLVCYVSVHNKKVMLFGYCEGIKNNDIYIGGLNYESKQCKKITNAELINLLENLQNE